MSGFRQGNGFLIAGLAVFFVATIAPNGAFAKMAYRFVNDQVSVEAEDLGYSGSSWEKATAKSGYTGSGYMIYKGPEMAPPAPTQSNWETNPEQNDVAGQYQGSESTWLKVPVYIEVGGTYFINVRNQHEHNCFEPWCYNDGDATVWTHVVDYPLPVRLNFGHSHTDNNSWMWMKFGPGLAGSDIQPNAPFQWRTAPGLVTFYVAGRDPNFKVDRIHIYRMTGPNTYPANHNNNNAPLSTLSEVTTGVIASPHMHKAAAARTSQNVIADLRGRTMGRQESARGVCLVASQGGQASLRLTAPLAR